MHPVIEGEDGGISRHRNAFVARQMGEDIHLQIRIWQSPEQRLISIFITACGLLLLCGQRGVIQRATQYRPRVVQRLRITILLAPDIEHGGVFIHRQQRFLVGATGGQQQR